MDPSNVDCNTDYNTVIDAIMPGTSDQSKTTQDDVKPTAKGVENAKKRLRAFSIQKKSLSPVQVIPPKPISTPVGAVGTVFIGRLASTKQVLKPGEIEEVSDPKKLPKPPKPGTSKLQNADYLNIQKKTLSEIEDMKRKMELVDLGIPLGLICPPPNSDKAMPTKAMPPIKSMMLARKLRILRPIKKEAKKKIQKLSCNGDATKNPAKVDEIIREAKKAKAEGKQFKFNYEKLLPMYENPFARKKDKSKDRETLPDDPRLSRDRQKYSDNSRRYFSHRDPKKRDRDRYREEKDKRASVIRDRQERELHIKHRKDKSKKDYRKTRETQSKDYDVKPKNRDLKSSKDSKPKDRINTINLSDIDDNDVQEVIAVPDKDVKETDVNLKDFVVCDSWSENEDKSKEATPKDDKKEKDTTPSVIDSMEQQKKPNSLRISETPLGEIIVGKLHPVTDSLKFEIEDVNDDDDLDMFSVDTDLKKFAKPITIKKEPFDLPIAKRNEEGKDSLVDVMDESFLESVIAEIKQEAIDENTPQHFDNKGLVEYDPSPNERESVTPEIDDKIREMCSNRSDFSDGYKSVESVKSTESGFKSTESGYKSTESGYKSTEHRYNTENCQKDRKSRKTARSKSDDGSSKSDDGRSKSTDSQKSEASYKSTESGRKVDNKKATLKTKRTEEPGMAKATMDSLETWTFVMKICQPLLFRHDKHKCYKETHVNPKIWFAENPKNCDCVKDRSVVYEELEMCKMDLVDNLYNKACVQEAIYPDARGWYPSEALVECGSVALCSEWEAEDSQERPTPPPHARDEMLLDREYQKFMEAVWPDVEEPRSETPRCTPLREVKKRAAEEPDTGKKKKMKVEGKVSSEGWSQESEVEEEMTKFKKQKVVKVKRKRKHSTSLTDSVEDSSSKKKKMQKKEKKETPKVKSAKRQRLSKKYLKKLKEKQVKQLKKKKKQLEEEIDEQERERKRRERKLKKKKIQKQKKKNLKKKKAKSSSTSSSSDSEPDKKSKKKEKRKKHKKRKQSTSDSNQSDELFDANILKNIKTERLTDDEKKFSPNKIHRQIINVKELQDDFVIQIKKEVEDGNSPEQLEAKVSEETSKEIQVDEKGDGNQAEGSEVSEVKVTQPIEEKDDTITVQDPPTPQLLPLAQQIQLSTPQIQLPTPPIQLPTPQIQLTTPQIQQKTPQIQQTAPQIQQTTPQVQQTTPQIQLTTPQIQLTTPQIQLTTPEIQLTTPQIQLTTPQIQLTTPQIQQTSSQIQQTTPQVQQTTPQIQLTTPQIQLTTPQIQLTTPQIQLPTQQIQIRTPQIQSPVPQILLTTPPARNPTSQIQLATPQIQTTTIQKQSPIPQIHISTNQIHSPISQILPITSQIRTLTSQIHIATSQIHIATSQIPLPSPQEDIHSQSSQESISSATGHYEKDTSHLRPSSQNSNYTFHDVMEQNDAAQNEGQSELYEKGEALEMEGEYPRGNYEMYEQMAMEYQSDVASQRVRPPDSASSGRIETVVGAPRRGEIKCDWRPGDKDKDRAGSAPARPSRWGLKPSEVNIVLTGGSEGGEQYPIRSVIDVAEPAVYRIQSIANRTDNSNTGYDEAYMDMYGASDRLQYGDCFSHHSATSPRPAEKVTSSLDERINRVLEGVEKTEANDTSDSKGILVTKSLTERSVKRVSFADGYQPGQDSDTEAPPVRKKKKVRRVGCPWPCPAEHPDHVALWDALPPPPPPPGSPPPPAPSAPAPAHMLREGRPRHNHMMGLQAPHHMAKFDTSSMSGFMPPEPPPGLISF